MQEGGVAAKVKPSVPPRGSRATLSDFREMRKILRDSSLPKQVADEIAESMQTPNQKKSKGK